MDLKELLQYKDRKKIVTDEQDLVDFNKVFRVNKEAVKLAPQFLTAYLQREYAYSLDGTHRLLGRALFHRARDEVINRIIDENPSEVGIIRDENN